MSISVRMPRRMRAFGVLAFAFTLLLATRGVLVAAPALTQLSSDPYTNTTSQHQTEVEPDSLSFGSTIVSAIQVGRFFNGGANNIGFATSTDNGATFTHGFLPGTTVFATPAGSYDRASDPVVAFDARHNVWLISYLGIRTAGTPPAPHIVDVLVSRSTDGGLTWGNPVVVSAQNHFLDKNWTVCDNAPRSPFYGNCYTEFDDNTLGDLIEMSTSTNGGAQWGPALATANQSHGIGGQPLVQPNGTVIVPINGFQGRHFTLLSFTSTDGGGSWSATTLISKVRYHLPAGGIRATIPLPSAEIDKGGRVYVAWPDCRFEPGCKANDMVLSTSNDGVNWTAVTRIPIDPIKSGVDHFIPGLAVDDTTGGSKAHLALTFYFYPVTNCTTTTCQLDVGFVSSRDGGATWSAETQLAGPMALTWLPNTTQGVMVGDYVSTSFAEDSPAFPFFALASAPSGGIFDEALFTVTGGIELPGNGHSSGADQVVVSDDNGPVGATPPTAQ